MAQDLPIDPFYLTWKARQYEVATRFIELAGEVNTAMPEFVVNKAMVALNDQGKCARNSRVLVLGVAYKPDICDLRESPALRILELLQGLGARVSYHDPFVPRIPRLRNYQFDLASIPLTPQTLREHDCVMVITNHSSIDYQMVADSCPLVVDTRNCVPPTTKGCVVKA